ncbi:MAG: hypothetical protein JWN13_6739 [Betaproteobacteria bacterium]|jgi:hypothetical protein|nr:hypothetical protein [Betaproteobacteria bacterium]
MSQRLGMALAVACALQATSSSAAEGTLDYAFFKTKVEPVFLQKRPDHVRCYVCHSDNNSAFKLEKLPAGKSFWTEEQSRTNFEVVSKLVVPGNADASLLLTRPLAPQAGGHAYHSGGRQFESRNDPEWKVLAAWVNGQKAAAR